MLGFYIPAALWGRLGTWLGTCGRLVIGLAHHLGNTHLQCDGSPGSGGWREVAMRRKAAVQAPGEEHGLAEGVVMGQTASVEGGHKEISGALGEDSHKTESSGRLPIGRRFPTCPTAPWKCLCYTPSTDACAGKEQNFSGEHFWDRGYAVSTVGFELEQVRQYIREQENADGTDGQF